MSTYGRRRVIVSDSDPDDNDLQSTIASPTKAAQSSVLCPGCGKLLKPTSMAKHRRLYCASTVRDKAPRQVRRPGEAGKEARIDIAPISTSQADQHPDLPSGGTPSEDTTSMRDFLVLLQLFNDQIKEPGRKGFKGVSGQQQAKRTAEESIIYPLKKPELFVGIRKQKPRLLMSGPPGVGKTKIAEAIAREVGAWTLSVDMADVSSSYVGESTIRIKALMQAATARAAATERPVVIHIDEIEAIVPDRRKRCEDGGTSRQRSTQFLQSLDQLPKNVGIVATTNFIEQVDPAFRRRFGTHTVLNLPTPQERLDYLKTRIEKHCRRRQEQHDIKEHHWQWAARATTFFSYDDLKTAIGRAGRAGLRDANWPDEGSVLAVTWKHLQWAIRTSTPTSAPDGHVVGQVKEEPSDEREGTINLEDESSRTSSPTSSSRQRDLSESSFSPRAVSQSPVDTRPRSQEMDRETGSQCSGSISQQSSSQYSGYLKKRTAATRFQSPHPNSPGTSEEIDALGSRLSWKEFQRLCPQRSKYLEEEPEDVRGHWTCKLCAQPLHSQFNLGIHVLRHHGSIPVLTTEERDYFAAMMDRMRRTGSTHKSRRQH